MTPIQPPTIYEFHTTTDRPEHVTGWSITKPDNQQEAYKAYKKERLHTIAKIAAGILFVLGGFLILAAILAATLPEALVIALFITGVLIAGGSVVGMAIDSSPCYLRQHYYPVVPFALDGMTEKPGATVTTGYYDLVFDAGD